jgi:hypothetical protein
MRIRRFEDFVDGVNESYLYGGYRTSGGSSYMPSEKGKNKFSRWMRGISDGLRNDMEARSSNQYSPEQSSVKDAKDMFSIFGRIIFGAGAAIADFFSLGNNKDTFSKMSKEDLEKNRGSVLDSWEKKNLDGKNLTQKDAEDFYKSGVLQGNKYFGTGYNPENPRNFSEKQYGTYLEGAMTRYYNRLSPDHAK